MVALILSLAVALNPTPSLYGTLPGEHPVEVSADPVNHKEKP